MDDLPRSRNVADIEDGMLEVVLHGTPGDDRDKLGAQ
jgi:hypothetical protein